MNNSFEQSNKVHRNIYIALLVAQGVVIGLLERLIPFPFAFAPGAKLGLANLITVVAIFTLSFSDVITLTFLRVILTALLGGTLSTFLYSFGGAFLSLFAMVLVKQLGPKRVSLIGISATGGVMHNVGQLVVASLIAKTWTVMLYLPVLSIIGLCAGTALGIAANYLFTHVTSLSYLKFTHEQQTKE
ncbi:Gx transporter family protein [Lactiplantibacillus fabifermentans]|uniref:Heptaprenyl diphosphate synthase component I n=2 Tax=Lactiplantibacillus fabifermentans TaxID=483011 RepID=A0A0R2NLT4_9LACO|nr:Gx transporter family protein [Lactiplantibacillus fabifermentans]ETY74790.1 heptaprenyl diphosphate synthase subunit I [Lactiplantibacillus fabifermentans T30PCM01]KRO26712.1 heptaprenyl diphosphate synthase component I [Lactiplantibacillus fabifermentans DSM 21115]